MADPHLYRDKYRPSAPKAPQNHGQDSGGNQPSRSNVQQDRHAPIGGDMPYRPSGSPHNNRPPYNAPTGPKREDPPPKDPRSGNQPKRSWKRAPPKKNSPFIPKRGVKRAASQELVPQSRGPEPRYQGPEQQFEKQPPVGLARGHDAQNTSDNRLSSKADELASSIASLDVVISRQELYRQEVQRDVTEGKGELPGRMGDFGLVSSPNQDHSNQKSLTERQELDKAVKPNLKEQEKVSQSLMALMSSLDDGHQDTNVRDLQKKFRDFRDDYDSLQREMKNDIAYLKTSKEVKGSGQDQTRTFQRLGRVEDRLQEVLSVKLEVSKLRDEVRAQKTTISTLSEGSNSSEMRQELDMGRKEVEALVDTCDELKDRVEALEAGSSKAQTQASSDPGDISSFMKRLEELHAIVQSARKTIDSVNQPRFATKKQLDDLSELKDLVKGDKGLIDSLAEMEEFSDMIRDAMKAINDDIWGMQQDVDVLKKSVSGSGGSGGSARKQVASVDEGTTSAQSPGRDLGTLREQLKAFREESKTRDELFLEEIQRQEKSTGSVQKSLSERLAELESVVARLGDQK